MSYQLYYVESQDRLLSAKEIDLSSGIKVDQLSIDQLNGYKIYPFFTTVSPFDKNLYETSYTIEVVSKAEFTLDSGEPAAAGDYATNSWSKTDKPLNEAREYAYRSLKVKFEEDAKELAGDWGLFALVAIAGKTSTPKTDEEISVFTDLKILSDTLASNIDAVQSASDVDEIDSIIN